MRPTSVCIAEIQRNQLSGIALKNHYVWSIYYNGCYFARTYPTWQQLANNKDLVRVSKAYLPCPLPGTVNTSITVSPPTRSLYDLSQGRDNNLNLLRFAAATMVIFTHTFDVMGLSDPTFRVFGVSAGSYAVNIFFIISGFLVTRSWYRHCSLRHYLRARFLRIYPGLWVAVLASVFLLGPCLTILPLHAYIVNQGTIKFLLENTTLLLKGVFLYLPGVFTDGHSHYANVSLWTLPYEVKMYLVLAAFAFAGLTLTNWFLPFITFASFALFFWLDFTLGNAGQGEPYRLAFFFFAGASMYRFAPNIQCRTTWAALLLLVGTLAALPAQPDVRRFIVAIMAPYLIMYVAFIPRGFIRKFNKLGDYSYGLYIYAFPVQQVLIRETGSHSVLFNFLSAVFTTLCLAVVSWHLVESRALADRSPTRILVADNQTNS